MKDMFKKELSAPSINILSRGVELKGDLTIDGDFRLDGKLYGNVKCSGKLTIGTSGNIEGQIECKNAEVAGEVNGTIIVSELLVLKETSIFNGDINTGQLTVEVGAKLAITCKTTIV